MRRIAALIAMVVGVGLLAIPFAFSLFTRTADAERILDRFEFLTADGNPARYLREAELTRAGSRELVDEALPAVARDTGLELPALASGRAAIRDAHAFSVRYSRQLDAVDHEFRAVYDIPLPGLPLTALPWLFVAGGVVTVAAAVLALRRRAGLVVLLVLGVAMVAGPLALGAPGKAAAGEDVKAFASRGLSQRAADAAQGASRALDAVVAETRGQTLPALARREGLGSTALAARLAAEYPDAARLLVEWDVIGPRLSRLADAVAASLDEFASARRMPISAPVWLLLGGGMAISLSAFAALAVGRRAQMAPAAASRTRSAR